MFMHSVKPEVEKAVVVDPFLVAGAIKIHTDLQVCVLRRFICSTQFSNQCPKIAFISSCALLDAERVGIPFHGVGFVNVFERSPLQLWNLSLLSWWSV